jgi:flagellar motor switch protein FliN/FliY
VAEAAAPPAEAAAQPASADAPAQAAAQDAPVSKESIDALLKQANFESPEPADAAEGKALSVEELLKQANSPDAPPAASEVPGSDAEAFKLPSFQQVMADAQVSSIDLLRDVELNVKIELGRSRMLVDEVLKLSEGSVVELDKLAGDPVDVFVNDRLVARGEVLVLNDNFCVRVNEIVPGAKEEAV